MKLYHPLKGVGKIQGIYVSQEFGEDFWDQRLNNGKGGWYYKTLFNMNGHNGRDYAAPLGTPVYAPHDAYVIENTEKDTGYGLRTTLYFEEDGYGWEIVLGHFKTGSSQFENIPYNIKNRQHFVKAGTLLAGVNSTGNSTGNHTHLGLRQYKNGKLLNSNNGFFGSIDPRPYLVGEIPERKSMQLIRDKGTVYLVAGVNQKVKTGIASQEVLAALFGDEPIVDGDTSATPQSQTVSTGLVIHKK